MTLTQDAGHGARASAKIDPDTPIILMGYYNPIYAYGVDAFSPTRCEAGVGWADRRRPAAGGR
ncbi:MAG: tryptophan synthase subunit alpha [Thalassobaculum sp.]